MIEDQYEYIQQHNHAAQIANTIRLSRYFLISILIVCLYIFCIYHFYSSISAPYFYTWFFSTEIIVCMFWLVSTVHFKPGLYNLSHAHRWLQIQCFTVGCLVATGIYILTHDQPKF